MSEDSVFHPVVNPATLLPILKERLPVSCMMYNQVLHFPNFNGDLVFYTIGKVIDSKTWILSNNIRSDYPSNYITSAPNSVVYGEEPVSDNVRECFVSGGGVINWDGNEQTLFPPAPKPISSLITDIAVNLKGLVTELHPCYLYYMEPEEARQLEITVPDIVQVRRLDPSSGEGNFIRQNWKYSLPGSENELAKCVERNPSGGVFVDGECVSGVYIPALGFLSGLFTLKPHRNKGYAKLVMKFVFKEYANEGFIPCLTVEIPNKRSVMFHEGLGLRKANQVNGIIVHKLEID